MPGKNETKESIDIRFVRDKRSIKTDVDVL